jgi:hypothetical protein
MKEITEAYNKVMSYESVAVKRFTMRSALGQKSIRGDYKDPSICDQDFNIAIWKGVVELLLHHKYEYECAACSSRTYKNKRGLITPINKKEKICPNCKSVKITKTGNTTLTKNHYITFEEYQKSYEHLTDDDIAPQYTSPMIPIQMDKKYNDPYNVINDESQSGKFFGTYVYGYLKQQLRENKRVQKKTIETVEGQADLIIAQEITATFQQLNIAHDYIKEYNKFIIKLIQPLLAKVEATSRLIQSLAKAQNAGISINIFDREIHILSHATAPIISGQIMKGKYISQTQNSTSIDDNTQIVDLLNTKTVRGQMIEELKHTEIIEQNDFINNLRQTLPEGHCRAVFDIYLGDGESYSTFAESTDGIIKKSTVAEYLGIKPKIVEQHISTIKLALLATSDIGTPTSCRTSLIKEKINMSIEELNLPIKIVSTLLQDNINTISDLIECDNASLLMINDIEENDIIRIDNALKKIGLQRNPYYTNN